MLSFVLGFTVAVRRGGTQPNSRLELCPFTIFKGKKELDSMKKHRGLLLGLAAAALMRLPAGQQLVQHDQHPGLHGLVAEQRQ